MSIPVDAKFGRQWHLHNTTEGEYDLNVTAAWDDYSGKGVSVMVMDNGFDYSHSDLAPNYKLNDDHDYGTGNDDAAPVFDDDNHGTAVMGIIGAARNGTGAVGVAYGATLLGARVDFNETSVSFDDQFVEALGDAISNGADVVNMSFGSGGFFAVDDSAATGLVRAAAIHDATSQGRDGLGLILVKSAGNGRLDDANTNDNKSDANTEQVICAAVDRNGFVSGYSSPGAPILVAAFGSPFNGQIYTTDRVGANGYNTDPDSGDFTGTFNGTSSAAPMVSGVVTLMLEANADLGWRDVQSILAASARHVGSAINGESLSGSESNLWAWNAATNWNGGAMHYSADYGYGLVDALAAVRLAETWTAQSTTSNQMSASVDLTDTTTVITDGDAVGESFTAAITDDIVVERVTVQIDFETNYAGDFELFVAGPDGVEWNLIKDAGGGTDVNGYFTFQSQSLRGTSSKGDWTVRVADDDVPDTVTVRDIVVTVFGAAPDHNDTYIYTNEFSDYLDTHARNLADTDGGRDTLNASAVATAMTVNLATGTGKIDGVAMKVAGIENVFGGDGMDTLVGSKAANDLSGGRGADLLTGGLGADDFIYRMVRDSLLGKRADRILDFGNGDDLIDLSDIDTKAKAGDQGFSFIGKSAFSGVAGQLHYVQQDKKGTANDLTVLTADLDGNETSDFMIELAGLHKLVKTDFML